METSIKSKLFKGVNKKNMVYLISGVIIIAFIYATVVDLKPIDPLWSIKTSNSGRFRVTAPDGYTIPYIFESTREANGYIRRKSRYYKQLDKIRNEKWEDVKN